ncbi:MAG: DUF4388 domain-containing protein [Polyangiaceae bacterium]|jgi:hypothetical protein
MRGIVMTQKPPVTGEGSANGAQTSGFQARIKGASLADLIQMECLAGSKLVVRVTSGSKVGYLYFRGGSVVHATTPTSSGEPAAMEMLAWNGGTFEPADREWSQDTISSNWQNLLLRAAQIRDEKQTGSVVALRADGAERRGTAKTDHAPLGESIEFDVTPLLVAGHTLRSEDFQLFFRMNREGAVVDSHGSTQALADIVAYALQLSKLVGDQLGLERFAAMECTFKSGRCFVVLEPEGEVVALEPHASADSGSLRELLGL